MPDGDAAAPKGGSGRRRARNIEARLLEDQPFPETPESISHALATPRNNDIPAIRDRGWRADLCDTAAAQIAWFLSTQAAVRRLEPAAARRSSVRLRYLVLRLLPALILDDDVDDRLRKKGINPDALHAHPANSDLRGATIEQLMATPLYCALGSEIAVGWMREHANALRKAFKPHEIREFLLELETWLLWQLRQRPDSDGRIDLHWFLPRWAEAVEALRPHDRDNPFGRMKLETRPARAAIEACLRYVRGLIADLTTRPPGAAEPAGAPAPTTTAMPVPAPIDPTDTMIIGWLDQRPGQFFLGKKIADSMRLKHGTIRKNLARLAKDGAILRRSRKGYSTLKSRPAST